MGALAVACGVLIVAFGVLATRRAPTDAQFGTEITCLVGGLVLIFLGVTLRRLDRLARAIGDPASRTVPLREALPREASPGQAPPGEAPPEA